MFPINIFGAITGALAGATGGKVDIGRAVEKAVSMAAQSPDTALVRTDAPAIAEAVKDALPAPRAMESLWPQILRQAMVFLGGLVVAKGWVRAEDWSILSGALLAAAPVVWRVVSTWRARASAKA